MSVDNTAPTASLTDPGADLRGVVALAATATDAGGVASVVFERSPAGAGTWTTISTDTSGPYTASLDTVALGDGPYDLRVVSTDAAGNTTDSSTTAVSVNNTAPTASLTDPGADLRGVVALAATAADAGGVASVVFQRSPAGAGTWTTIDTDSTEPYTASLDTLALGDGLYDLRVLVSDAAGNQTTSSLADRRIDNTAPDAFSLDAPVEGAAIRDGQTVSATPADAGSGIASVQFLTCAGTSCTVAAGTAIGSDTTSPYAVTWTSPPADGTYTLIARATDAAGNTTDSSTTAVSLDNAAPTAGLDDPGANLRGTVALSASAADSGTGVTGVVFERSPAGAADWTAIATDTTDPYGADWDTTAVPDGLYDLRVRATDGAGNTTTAAVAGRRVDNTAPAATLTDPGAELRGTVALDATATDAGSGVVSVVVQSSPAGDADWSTIATDTTAPFGADWETTAVSDGIYDLRIVATDAAGNTTTTGVSDRRVDNTPPPTTLHDPGADLGGTVTLSATTADAGGVASVVFQRSPAGAGTWTTIDTDSTEPYTASLDTLALGDGLYDLRVISTDAAGNSSVNTLTDRRVNNTAPAAFDLGGPADGDAVRDGQTLEATPSDGGGGIASVEFFYCAGTSCSVASGTAIGSDTTSPYAVTWTSQPADGTYTLIARATDAAGNTTDSSTTAVSVDNTAPTASLTDPGADLRGVVALAATATDAGGVASVVFQRSPAGAGTWTTIDTDSTEPYTASLDTLALGDGLYDLRVISTDAAGNSSVDTLTDRRVNNTAPAAFDLGGPADGDAVRDGQTLEATPSDGGGGIASVEFFYCAGTSCSVASGTAIGSDTTSPYAVTWTSQPADGTYTLIARATDAAGNTTDSSTTAVSVNNTAPTASLTDPGADLRGVVALAATATDAGGVASVVFQRSPAGAGTWTTIDTDSTEPYTASLDTLALGDGLYDLRVLVSDAAGNQTTSSLADRRIDNTAPDAFSLDAPVEGAAIRDGQTVSATPADAGSGIASVQFLTCAGTSCTVAAGTAIGSDTTSPYAVTWTSPPADGTYTLIARATDAAGNTTDSSTTAVSLDNAAPTAGLDDPGANLRGTVALSASAADSGTGVTGVVFERSPAGAADWTAIATDTTDPYGADWDTTAVPDGLYDLRVRATDGAGNTTTAAVAGRRVDNTAPADFSIGAPDDGAAIRNGQALSASPSDAGSGVAAIEARYCDAGPLCTFASGIPIGTDTSAPFSIVWSGQPADGEYTVVIRATDRSGNATLAPARTVLIDNTAPTAGLTDPGANLRGGVPLSATASDGGSGIDSVVFQRAPAGTGSWTTIAADGTAPYGTTLDTTVLADGLYDLRVVSTDAAGNSSVNTLTDRRVNNSAPGPFALGGVADGQALREGHILSAAPTDAGSGITAVEFRYCAGATCSVAAGTLIGTDTTVPHAVAWSAQPPDGTYTLIARATDSAGNTTDSATTTVIVDNTTPTGSLSDPGADLRGTVALAAAASDTGSGIASVIFQRSPAGAATWTTISTDTSSPYGASFDTGPLADGLYDLRVVVADGAGNTTTDAVAGRRVDNTAPLPSLADPGLALRGEVTLAATVTDAGAGVSSVSFERSPAGGATWTTIAIDAAAPYGATLDTTILADGLYDLRVRALDEAGNAAVSVRAGRRIDNTAPAPFALTAPAAGAVVREGQSVSAAPSDSGSGIASVVVRSCPGAICDWADGVALGSDATAPYAIAWNGQPADGRHTLVARATDAAGNTRDSAPTTIDIDNAPPAATVAVSPAGRPELQHVDPTGPTVYYRTTASGSLTMTVTATDLSGIARVDFPAISVPGFSGPGVSVTSAPFVSGEYVFDATNTTTPADAVVTTTDGAGNATTRSVRFVRDVAPPSGGGVTVTGPDAAGRVTIATDPGADAGSGIATGTAVLERRTASLVEGVCEGFGTWTPATAPDTLGPATCARYRLRLADRVGNATVYEWAGTAIMPGTAPAPAIPSPPPATPPSASPSPSPVPTPSPAPVTGRCLPSQRVPNLSRGSGRVTLSIPQLMINQRIYAAAIRRAAAIDAWLDSGIVARDLCGQALSADVFGAGVRVGVGTGPTPAWVKPTPRPIDVRAPRAKPGAVFRLTAGQLRTNQRIAAAAVRRANALRARLDLGLTGGDIVDGQIGRPALAASLAILGATPAGEPAAPSRTNVAPPAPKGGASFVPSAGQLLINQRVGQAAVRRLNGLRDELTAGLTARHFRRGSIGAADLAPGAISGP